ncbi:unnamed protein product [Alternaria alternata]
MSSRTIAVAGGTGKLGRAIVEKLITHGGYKVFILSRKSDVQISDVLGASILATDYDNVDSIVKQLETNDVDTVISTLGSTFGTDSEIALIKAAESSKKTTRYIPSIWGIPCSPEAAVILPTMSAKSGYLDILASTSLEYTAVSNGIFLDYYGFPKVKSYLGNLPRVIDMAGNAAAIPGSGDVPVVFSYSFDVGRFIAALLSSARWEKESVIIGDKMTWNEFLIVAEETKGTKFETKHDSLTTLQKGRSTALPSQRQLHPFFPQEKLERMCAMFGVLFENGFFNFRHEGSLNEKFPHIATKSVKALLKESWSDS